MKLEKLVNQYAVSGVMILIIIIIIFGYLGYHPIKLWDESRLVANAVEMLHDGDLVVTHYEGEPDMWNTKPPLMIWLQVFFMKLFGVNEWSARLPSALAALFTMCLLLMFTIRYMKSYWLGLIASLILATTGGYICMHVSQTGDYDALLILFTTLYCLSFYLFCETNKNKYLLLFFLGLTLAVLTKSVAGLLFLPALLIYVLWQKKLLMFLKNKYTYLGILGFLALVLGYYLLRESQNPGYIAAVIQNEWGGRYLEVDETNSGSIFFYVKKLSSWIAVFPISLFVVFLNKNRKEQKLSVFLLLLFVVYFLVISLSKTKLDWYVAPTFPFIALISAILIVHIFNILQNYDYGNGKALKISVPYIFLFLVFFTPVQKRVHQNFINHQHWYGEVEWYRVSYFLQDALRNDRDLNGFKVVYSRFLGHYDGQTPHIQFYIDLLSEKGMDISYENWQKLKSGDKIICTLTDYNTIIKDHYNCEILSQNKKNNIGTFIILKAKTAEIEN